MRERWDERYFESKNIYGTKPNEFFSKELLKITPGRILLPGEGEGRNAVFAAKQSWQVDAFDYSQQAVTNAKSFLDLHKQKANYFQADILNLPVSSGYFDVVGVFYLHLNEEDRSVAHQFISDSVCENGHIIMEVFSKKQLGRKSGGPQNESMLYDISEIKKDFYEFEPVYLQELEVDLDEGELHRGKAMVIRFVGLKK